ncbi:putative aspartic proteinase GIP2 [Silene latifolia]|uniref:putative aspartic proteinase GIP2 n=1 Tax=Silene latifolia TaxID=37657 RepID=UPI003D78535B
MASHTNLFLTLFLLSTVIFPIQISNAASKTYLLPIIKDIKTPQYYTTLLVGTPQVRVNLAIDLGNLWSWFTCDIVGYNRSSTFHPVSCDAPECDTYGRFGCVGCPDGPLKPSCTPINTCGAIAYSPQSNALYSGGAIEDVISLYSQSQNSAQLVKTNLRDYPFTCAPDKGPLKGLSPFTKGILTLARRPVALHAQISSAFKVPNKFALCLPATSNLGKNNGAMYFGGGPYRLPSTSKIDLSSSLVTTPLVINPNSTAPTYSVGDSSIEYFFNVRSIKVDGVPVRFKSSLLSFDKDGVGGTKISTLDPYTILHSDIYKSLIEVFVTRAKSMNITRVPSVAPFGACFSEKSVTRTKTGPNIPIIDLIFNEKSSVLHNKNGRWRIYPTNSMVNVAKKDVMCLGFVDGGSDPRTSIVIGGKQMEDNLIEFDLVENKLGVTSSLLHLGTSCSQFKGI